MAVAHPRPAELKHSIWMMLPIVLTLQLTPTSALTRCIWHEHAYAILKTKRILQCRQGNNSHSKVRVSHTYEELQGCITRRGHGPSYKKKSRSAEAKGKEVLHTRGSASIGAGCCDFVKCLPLTCASRPSWIEAALLACTMTWLLAGQGHCIQQAV